MKLNSFKFQDGKVFWLPEYPEKPNENNFQGLVNGKAFFDEAMFEYSMKVKESLASAIEVAPKDKEKVEYYIKLYIVTRNPGVGSILYHKLWQPENGKVYSAECEIEIEYYYHEDGIIEKGWSRIGKTVYDRYPNSTLFKKEAHLKPKEEIFPAANSHDMKDEDL